MGTVFKIQRYCIHDGPGIRTTVFLKGCPLNCLWCHNPESKKKTPEILWHRSKCRHCGRCSSICPSLCHSMEDGKHGFHSENCQHCFQCVSACPCEALERVGNEMTAEEVVAQVERDRIFYSSSGGGMTVSGGEPFAQPEFLLALLMSAKEKGIHTAIETCGFTSVENMRQAAVYTDLFLFDWKETDPVLHKSDTGQDNQKILENLELLSQLRKPVILRCPVIPGYNDRDDHFLGIADLTNRFDNIIQVDMEPYHNLGQSKESGLGKRSVRSISPPDESQVDKWRNKLEKICRCPVKVPAFDQSK